MGYVFERNEGVASGIVRILSEELNAALHQLQQVRLWQPEAVHEYRRHLKKARSLIRMTRFVLRKKIRRSTSRHLAEATRLLASWRDLEALVECTDRILASEQEPEIISVFETVRAGLMRLSEADKRNDFDLNNALDEAENLLRAVRADCSTWDEKVMTWSSLCEGVRCSYRDGRYAMLRAQAEPMPEWLHQWRKQTKHLRHHIVLVSEAWPAYFKALETELHLLTDLLGEIHDLVLLHAFIADNEQNIVSETEQVEAENMITRLMEIRIQQSLEKGAFLFVENPGAFHKRMSQYISLWANASQG